MTGGNSGPVLKQDTHLLLILGVKKVKELAEVSQEKRDKATA